MTATIAEPPNPATRAFVDELRARPDVVGVLLFGSWARGDHRPDSDVDLVVIIDAGYQRHVEYRGPHASSCHGKNRARCSGVTSWQASAWPQIR
jgi:predicted nucleotidyltransferase